MLLRFKTSDLREERLDSWNVGTVTSLLLLRSRELRHVRLVNAT